MNKVLKFARSFNLFEKILFPLSLVVLVAVSIVFKEQPIDLFVGVLLLLCLLFGSKGMIINAYFGIAYAVVYGIVCISRGIFGLGIMSLVYTLAVQIILLIIWHKNSSGNTVKVRGFTWLKRLMVLGIMAFIFAGLFFVLRFFSTNNQLLDAAVTTLNLTSMALLILRYYEAWFIAALAHLSNSILWLTTILAGSQSIVLFVSSVISFVFSAYAVYNWIKIQKIQKSL